MKKAGVTVKVESVSVAQDLVLHLPETGEQTVRIIAVVLGKNEGKGEARRERHGNKEKGRKKGVRTEKHKASNCW